MKTPTTTLHYHTLFRSEPEGGFTVIVPSLPGCISFGKTLKEAKKNIIDAIQGYLISLQKHHEPIPSDQEVFIGVTELPSFSSSSAQRKAYA